MLNRRISLQPQQTRDFSDTHFNFASASSANQTSSERNMGQMSCWLPPFFTFLHMRIHFPLYRVQFRYDRTVAINLFWQLIECEIFTVYFFRVRWLAYIKFSQGWLNFELYSYVSSMSMQWWRTSFWGCYKPEPSWLSNKAIVSPFIKIPGGKENYKNCHIHSVLLDLIHNYLNYN